MRKIRRTFQRWRRRGQTLVEFALVLPLLLLTVLGVIEFGRLFYGVNTLQNAARYTADFASKAPPHLGDAVPDDPEGRHYARPDLPDCGPDGPEPCYVANIRAAARRYAVLFSPSDPSIQIFFVPVNGEATNKVGGIVEVTIDYAIPPITPVLRDLAPAGVPVHVGARRTIVNLDFPYEMVTPLAGTPSPTPPPQTPLPGCGGTYTMHDEAVNGNVYSFQLTNVSGGDNRALVGMIVGWCSDAGQLLSVTIGGVPLPGTPADPPSVGLGGGGFAFNQGETVEVRMTFAQPLNPVNPALWPSWYLTFDDYCSWWSAERSCPYPTPTALPTLTPTTTSPPSASPTPWPTGTIPPLCGMYISDGPIFAGNSVYINVTNGGTSSPALDTAVVMWGPGAYPLQEARWDGTTVWSGIKYYSGRLEGLSGDFPAGTTHELRFVFGNGPINWLSFQALFDNGCYVSFSDPNQPPPPTMPTLTPTPQIGYVYLDIVDLVPAPGECGSTTASARAIAYYPVVGYNDGAGIQKVNFTVRDPNGNIIYQRDDSTSWYCLGSGNGPCTPLDVRGAQWISGTYTMDVTAYVSPAYGGYTRTEQRTFRLCKYPPHVEIVSFSPPSCGDPSLNVWAVAWEPLVCGNDCQDGQGISYVYFEITQAWDGQLVFRHREGTPCYCAGSGDCPCPAVSFANGVWPKLGASGDIGGSEVFSGTHILRVWVQTTQGREAEVSQSFYLCWSPCPLYTVDNRYISSGNVAIVFRNNSGVNRTVVGVHVENWPSGWGTLSRIRAGNWFTLNDPTPPADLTVSPPASFNKNSTCTITFDFANNANDANAISGYILLDNGCRIDF